ncbi:MAG: hypothetical protein AB1480_05340 [Nitrospirota bacterium]
MKDNNSKEALRAYFNDTVEKIEKYYNDPEQFNKIYTELGFTYVDDGCDGFCPECEQMLKCEVYRDIKDGWEWFYS